MESEDVRVIRVLLVEDNPGDILLVEEALAEARDANFQLVAVGSVAEAEAALASDGFDVVLLDLSLPDAEGLETLARIQVQPSHMPVVVLTGLDDEKVALRAVQEGAQDYLVKDGVFDTLLVRSLRYAIQRAGAKMALERSEERFRALMENSLDIVAVLDAEGTVLYTSPSGASVLGWPGEAVGDQSIYDLAHPDDIDLLRSSLAEAAATPGGKCAFYIRIRHEDGSWRALEALGQNLLDEPAVGGIVINARDVTERKAAEEELRRSEERFSKAFRTAPLSITLTTLDDGVILEVNEHFLEMSGYGTDELIGRRVQDLELWVAPADRAEATDRLRRVGALTGFEVELRMKDGSVRIVELYAETLDVDGLPCVIMLHQDVTDRKALETQLLQAQKMEAVGRLAGGIAHDFNNLITAIRGHADFLLEELAPGSSEHEDADEIRTNADRAAALTRQLLAFSRQQVLRPRVVDVGAVVRGAAGLLRQLVGEDIDFTVDIAKDVGRVEVDPGQLEQVLMNLCLNAKDAMANGGRLVVEAGNVELPEPKDPVQSEMPAGAYVVIAVTDTGAGMNAETREHIFDPFFTTKDQGKGTGLGLSTVYGVVKQSGGHIYCDSDAGFGTTFKVFLPRVERAVEIVAPAAEEEPGTRDLAGGETVLLVEDEHGVRNLARRVLEREGFQVLEAEGPSDALLRVIPGHPGAIHLLLTDVVMPDMGGGELAERVNRLHPGVRTIFMSGYSENEVVQRGIVTAGACFIEKPFTPSSLARQARAVLHADQTGASRGVAPPERGLQDRTSYS